MQGTQRRDGTTHSTEPLRLGGVKKPTGTGPRAFLFRAFGLCKPNKESLQLTRTADLLTTSELLSGQRRTSSLPCPSHHFTAVTVSVGTVVYGERNSASALLVTVSALLNHDVLEPEHFAYLPFVEAYYDFAVYDGGGGRLRVHLDHLLHCIEVSTDILLDKVNVPLR